MICFLICPGYERNVKALQEDPTAPEISVLRYDEALTKTSLSRGTYIFTGIDRLRADDLTKASRLFRRLQENGCRVLNDPARARPRFLLLRALQRSGINPFNVYSVEEGHAPQRFPVFLRLSYGHEPPLSDLIWDQTTLERAVDAAILAGFPRQILMVVEYAAEPVRPGLFRKLSAFRVGSRFVPHVGAHDASWLVKFGRRGVATEELYEEELQIIRENLFVERLRPAFEIANIDYGRADFGLIGDQICVYEINMNPVIGRPVAGHPFHQRAESWKISWGYLISALHALVPTDEAGINSTIDVGGDSLEALKSALARFPGLRNGHLRLSREYARRGELQAALRASEEGIKETPNNVALLRRLSRLLAKQQRFEEAITFADRVVELDPHRPKPLASRARLLRRSGRYQEALEAILKAIALKPDEAGYHRLLIRIHRRMGNRAAAIEAAQRARTLRPAEPGALGRLNPKRVWRKLSRHFRHAVG